MKRTVLFSCLLLASFISNGQQWATNGNHIYNTNSGGVGIGLVNPVYPLEVNGGIRAYGGIIADVTTSGAISGWFRGAANSNANVVIQGGQGIGYNAWWLTGSQSMFRLGAHGGTEPSSGAINIDYAGRVGIGMDPQFKFDVNSTSRFGAAASTNANIIVQGGAYTYDAYWLTATNGIFRVGGNGATEPSMGAMNIDNAGKIGIGRNPEFNVDIVGISRFGAAASTNANVIIQGGGGSGYNAWWLTGASGILKIGGAGATEPALGAINIDYAGNVGIGTSSTGSFRLAVEGKIGARELKVTLQNPWPDYVFHEEYNLLPIDDLEVFIRTNHHLPGIPSAREVKEKEGIEVGDMSARLLQKIEELTLYVIELKKENNAIKKEFQLLQRQKGKR